MRPVITRLTAARYAVVSLLAVLLGLRMQKGFYEDWPILEMAARFLVHRQPSSVALPGGILHLYYEMPELQYGPPAFVTMGPFQLLSPTPARLTTVIALMLAAVAAVGALERAINVIAPDGVARRRMQVGLLVGTVPALFAWGFALRWGHIDDALAMILLCLAAPSLARIAVGRGGAHAWWIVGLLLGTAAATKPWAIAFAPLILLFPRRDLPRAGLAYVATGAAWWAPFTIAAPGTQAALDTIHLAVKPGSALHALGVPIGAQPDWVRLAQLGLSVALGIVAVRRGRWASAPLVGLAGRFLLEPAVWPYYAAGPIIAAVFADALSGSRRPWRTPLVLLLTVVGRAELPAEAYSYVQLVGWAALAAALLLLPGAGTRAVNADPLAQIETVTAEPVGAPAG
jgi:hypothetical protein